MEVIRPVDGGDPEYVVIFRFDGYSNLRVWERSEVRARWLDRSRPLLQAPPKVQEFSGLETWFTLPSRRTAAPPKYKMAVITGVVIFPLATALSVLLELVGGWPLLLRSAVLTVVLVLLMTYAVMPGVTRLFRGWMYPPEPR
jgi:uncharacterized protein